MSPEYVYSAVLCQVNSFYIFEPGVQQEFKPSGPTSPSQQIIVRTLIGIERSIVKHMVVIVTFQAVFMYLRGYTEEDCSSLNQV